MQVTKTTVLEIVKLLPSDNCGECGEPLCMTYASKLLGGKKLLEDCPNLTEDSIVELNKVYQPPVCKISFGKGDNLVTVGEERVFYRHELRFFHPTAIGVFINDTISEDDLNRKLNKINRLSFERMGQKIGIDFVAVKCLSNSPQTFPDTIKLIKDKNNLPLILFAYDPTVIASGLKIIGDQNPLIGTATQNNWRDMAGLAKQYQVPVVVEAKLSVLGDLVNKMKDAGVTELVLAPQSDDSGNFSASLKELNSIRNMALNEKMLGYPTLSYPVKNLPESLEISIASSQLAKYANIIILNTDESYGILPLLTLRQSIYSDPTVPATVAPGLYIEGQPDEESPIMITGNFAMTYSMVSGDIRSANINAHLLVADSQGFSIGVACLLGTVTENEIASRLKESGVLDKVKHNYLVIPGLMESIKTKIEEATKMQVIVGPNDSRYIPKFMQDEWNKLQI